MMINTKATIKRIQPKFITIDFKHLITQKHIKDIRNSYMQAFNGDTVILYFNINAAGELFIANNALIQELANDKQDILYTVTISIHKSNNKHLNKELIKILSEYRKNIEIAYKKQTRMGISEFANFTLAHLDKSFITKYNFLIWLANHFDQIEFKHEYNLLKLEQKYKFATFILANMYSYNNIDNSAFNLLLNYIVYYIYNTDQTTAEIHLLQNQIVEQLTQKHIYFNLRQSQQDIDYNLWVDILHNSVNKIQLPLSALLSYDITDTNLLDTKIVFQPFSTNDINRFMTLLVTTDYSILNTRLNIFDKLYITYDCSKYQQEISSQLNKLPIFMFSKNGQKILCTLKSKLFNE